MKLIRFSVLLFSLFFSQVLLAEATKSESISLQLKWLHQFQFAGYYAAKEKGFYAHENLDVTIKERQKEVKSTQEVIDGHSEYGVADTSLIKDRLNGAEIIVLASIFQHNPLVYITLKSSGIVSPYELKGKRIMQFPDDNAPFIAMLNEARISPSEVTFLDHNLKNDDLINGKIDAMSAYLTDEVNYFKQKGVEINVIDPRNYGIDFLGDNLFTTEKELKTHPERVERFLRASLKGWDYALQHPDEIIDLILKKYNANNRNSKSQLEFEAKEVMKMIMPHSVQIGTTDVKRFERIASIYQSLGLVKSTERLNGFIYEQSLKNLEITPKERAWLKAHPIIRVGVDPNFAPYEWFNESDEYIGLSAEYIRLVEKLLCVKLEIVHTSTWAETLELAKSGKIDMISDVNKTPSRESFLSFTQPYISNPIIIVSDDKNGFIGNLNRLNSKKVAVEASYYVGEMLEKNYPNIEIFPVKSVQDALLLVSKNEVNAYVGDAAAVNYAMRKNGLFNLKFAGETEYHSIHRMAAIKQHPELVSLLDKVLNSLTESQRGDIENRWMSLKIEKKLTFTQILKYVLPFLIVLILVVYWNLRLRREITKRLELEGALKESIQLFKSVIDNTPVIRVFWKDINGFYLGGNSAFVKDAGFSEVDEILGKDDYEMGWWENADIYRADDQVVMQRNQPKLNYEEQLILPNGQIIWLKTSKVPLHNAKNEVIGIIGIYEDITVHKEHQQELEYIAHHDMLTNLPNRLLLADRMQIALSQAKRDGTLIAVGYLDLDSFKDINDTFGNKLGDYLLIEIAKRIKNELRECDTVARLGGDEFALLLVDLERSEECEMTLRRLLTTISVPFYINEKFISVSPSIGVTLFPNDSSDADTLLRHADHAMYEAKQAGKNCFKFYNLALAQKFQTHQVVLNRIEQALIKKEFELHFQPKVDMKQGKVIGAEALIRWRHSERGLMTPGEFLPVVEHHAFITQLDAWVMESALKHMEEWLEQGIKLNVSINISARSLQIAGFVNQLQSALTRYPKVKPHHLEIEILETEALSDLAQTSQIIRACQKLGVKFALDDFGTGYSSLSYLKHLPADTLKIDQSFVHDMLEDEDDLAIVQGVIGLAESFHRHVIAEGVETIEHGTALLQMRCYFVQGYGIAKPMTANDFIFWLQTWEVPKEWQRHK